MLSNEEKLALALDLLRRARGVIEQTADNIEASTLAYSGKSLVECKLEWAERSLASVEELVGERGPDPNFWRDMYLLDGRHAVLTEEGWEPAEGVEPDTEILDEVNRPTAA